MEKYFDYLKAHGADLAVKIDAKSIVTAAWTVYRCQYGCNRYGNSHRCPPKAPTYKQTQEMIDCYSYGILFRCHDMSAATPLAVDTVRELFLDNYYKAIAFGCGPCTLCETCNPDRCNFPHKAIPSMEACGIDVFATLRNNGLDLHTLRDKEDVLSCFGLILVE